MDLVRPLEAVGELVVVLAVAPEVGVVEAQEDLILPPAHLQLPKLHFQSPLLPRLPLGAVLEVPRLLPSWSAPL